MKLAVAGLGEDTGQVGQLIERTEKPRAGGAIETQDNHRMVRASPKRPSQGAGRSMGQSLHNQVQNSLL